MGNCWKGLSREAFEMAELKMLMHSGLKPLEDFQIKDVIIDDFDNYIHTIELGDRSK